MQILLLDETNVDRTKASNFFIYGGVFCSLDIVPQLHVKIEKIRAETGFKNVDLFKFDTNTRPAKVSSSKFNQAKEMLLDECIDKKVSFIAYIVHHKIAHKHSLKKKIEWSSSEIIDKFNQFLLQRKEYGIVVFDKLPFRGDCAYIRKLFTQGITTATSRNFYHVPRNILGYNMTTSGASHLNSLADIVLGSFRYCVNSREDNRVARKLFPKIMQLMHGSEDEKGNKNIRNAGLLVMPHNPFVYFGDYKKLLTKLKTFL